MSSAPASQSTPTQRKKPVLPVTPRLRVVLYVVLTLFGALLANGLYLATITWMQYFTGKTYENHFYQLMFLGHFGFGLLLILPVIGFGTLHMWRAKNRRNRRAVKIGYALFAVAIVILLSGVLLTRIGSFQIVDPGARSVVYWAHIASPLIVIWLYWLHRLVGPRIKWHIGRKVGVAIGCFVVAMVAFQASDPRVSEDIAPADGDKYFQPSLAKTASGKFISETTLMNDEYCLSCHGDIHDDWLHSAHKLSSFNNPAYRASVRETREVSKQRSGDVKASRWCAGCHDPVPFFSGKFDDPDYDDVGDPTAHAGITCTVCHAIQSIDSHVGNADYTIDEPKHYPFAYSKNGLLKQLNALMVKAKPDFHKREMLKPFHKSAEFCSTCHKVSLPFAVTHYKEWLRGQNHYDTYLLSGVSGHGSRSFYYPEVAKTNCNECHMKDMASSDLGAKMSTELGELAVAGHRFPSANTALSHWFGDKEGIDAHRRMLEGSLRVDLFGLRESGATSGKLVAPLGDDNATVIAGESYLIETVLRTLTLGHHFTQGTTDSNQIWVELIAKQGDKVIGKSGTRDEREAVDPWSHFVNTFMLDKNGRRIDRRNAQDIFTPIYSHQIPPGAGQAVHYEFKVPEGSKEPIEVTAKLLYRKFDTRYMDFIRKDRDPERDPLDLGKPGDPNDLPIIEIASDTVTLKVGDQFGIDIQGDDPIAAAAKHEKANSQKIPTWQRWNDYGIGLLLNGKSELLQAYEAFDQVEALGRFDGPMNKARAQFAEGDVDGATESLTVAKSMEPPPPTWTHGWLSGSVNRRQGNYDEAVTALRGVLETKIPERKFDFSKDYVVRNELALALIDVAEGAENDEEYKKRLREAQREFEIVLDSDSENVTAHWNLAEIFGLLDETEREEHHRRLHARYKRDDNASEVASIARTTYPAANFAASRPVKYQLQRSESSSPEKDDLAESTKP